MEKSVKKLKFYVPALMLAAGLTFSPMASLEVRAEEEEEVLYEDKKDDYTQEDINDDTAENTQTKLPADEEKEEIVEATPENNENDEINNDEDKYLDNTNYDPSTDDSENPGDHIPEDTKDEVDRKGLDKKKNPPKKEDTPEDTPSEEQQESTPETTTVVVEKTPDKEIPKTGLEQKDVNKATAVGALSLIVLLALREFAAKYLSHRAAVKNAKLDGTLVKVEKAKKKYSKKQQKKLELKK